MPGMGMHIRAGAPIGRLLAAVGLCALTACGGSDFVGAYVQLQPDGKGVVTTRSLQPSQAASPAEGKVEGVKFQQRANLLCSSGTFENITEVRIGGVRFVGWRPKDESPDLTVVVPMGDDAAWARALAPSLTDGDKVRGVFDPKKQSPDFGALVRFELELPGEVVSFGTYPRVRGVTSDSDGRTAELVIPVKAALAKGQDDLRWTVNWKP